MSGWDSWATNVLAAGGATGGAALYDPCSGAIWGKSCDFNCSGGLQQYDAKADGKGADVPDVNCLKFMFIRKTLDDDPVSVFKKGQDSLFTTKGPSGSRIAVLVKDVKPEPVITKVIDYLKPHV